MKKKLQNIRSRVHKFFIKRLGLIDFDERDQKINEAIKNMESDQAIKYLDERTKEHDLESAKIQGKLEVFFLLSIIVIGISLVLNILTRRFDVALWQGLVIFYSLPILESLKQLQKFWYSSCKRFDDMFNRLMEYRKLLEQSQRRVEGLEELVKVKLGVTNIKIFELDLEKKRKKAIN